MGGSFFLWKNRWVWVALILAKPPLWCQYVHHFPQEVNFKGRAFVSTSRPAPRHLGTNTLLSMGLLAYILK